MQLWYTILDVVLPFDWLSYAFMKNALLAILFVAPTFGLLSTMVVNNKLAIGHLSCEIATTISDSILSS